jgi:hypothetical protein
VATGGALSIAYAPEHGRVQLYASDPKDKRKAGVFIGLTHAEYEQLKRMLRELDAVIAEEANVVVPRMTKNLFPVPGTDHVAVATTAGTVHLPIPVLELVRHVASTQSHDAAQDFLVKSLPGLAPSLVAHVMAALLESEI